MADFHFMNTKVWQIELLLFYCFSVENCIDAWNDIKSLFEDIILFSFMQIFS